MKKLKISLRLWIAAASVTGFLSGWILFAQAGKPVNSNPAPPLSEQAPLPTLAPLPSLNGPGSGLQPLQPLQDFRALPRLRTGGS
jgi:hypothetical protein